MKHEYGTYRSAWTFALLSVIILLGGFAPRALAQGTSGSLPDPISSRDLQKYAQRLELDSDQRLAVAELHQRYLGEFRELRENEIQAFVDRMTALETDMMPEAKVVKELLDRRRRVMSLIEETDKRFLESIEDLLTREQLPLLESVARSRARTRLSDSEFNFGGTEPVDLGEILDELDLSDEEKALVADARVQYEIASLNAVREVHDLTMTTILRLLEKLDDMGFDQSSMEDPAQMAGMFEAMQTAMQEVSGDAIKASRRLKDLTRRSADEIAGLLPPASGQRMRDAYLAAAYPEVYPDRSAASPYLDAALGLQDLDDSLRRSVTDLAERYHDAHDRLCKSMVELIDERDEAMSGFDMEAWSSFWERSQELEQQRETLNEETTQALGELLDTETYEQVVRIATRIQGEDDGESVINLPGGVVVRSEPMETNPEEISDARARPMWAIAARPVNRSDVSTYSRLLGLSDDQRAAVMAVHDVYLDQVEALREGDLVTLVHEPQRRMSTENAYDKQAYLQYTSGRDRVRERLVEIDAEFFDEVELLLEPGQLKRLPLVLGMRHRALHQDSTQQWTMYGFVGPLGVDLITLVASTPLEDETLDAIVPLLTEYGKEIGPQLETLHGITLRQQDVWITLYADYDPEDLEDQATMIELGMKAQERMKEINREAAGPRETIIAATTRTIAGLIDAMPPEEGDRLLQKYYEKAYPQVYPDASAADRTFEEAMTLRDLSTPQYEQLQAAYDEYAAKHAELCGEMIGVLSQYRGNTGFDSDAWRDMQAIELELERIRFERTELNASVRNRIEAMLTSEQAERMRTLQVRE
jgi:hypothetical protein